MVGLSKAYRRLVIFCSLMTAQPVKYELIERVPFLVHTPLHRRLHLLNRPGLGHHVVTSSPLAYFTVWWLIYSQAGQH